MTHLRNWPALLLSVVLTMAAGCQPSGTASETAATAETATEEAPQWNPREERLRNDWAFLARYRDANEALPPRAESERRVVFYGDSITEGWAEYFADMFPGKLYVGRGISGQTTSQMLVRMRQDVIDLDPAVVVILAGTNDIAGNTGPSTLEMIEGNIRSMVELARANGIAVVLCAVLPANTFFWAENVEPADRIVELNGWIKTYAADENIPYVDYHSPMVDDALGLKEELGPDGVHPNEDGYRVMARLVEPAIEQALIDS